MQFFAALSKKGARRWSSWLSMRLSASMFKKTQFEPQLRIWRDPVKCVGLGKTQIDLSCIAP